MRRCLALLFTAACVLGALPAQSSAQVVASATPAPTDGCRPLAIPELEEVDADDAEIADLLVGRILCAGQRLRVRSEERRLRIEAPDLEVDERDSEVDVTLPRTPIAPAPQREPEEIDPAELALETGAAIKQENETFVHETPTSRHETNESETKVDGRDFDYESKETEEEIEEPGFESEEKETEEEFRSR